MSENNSKAESRAGGWADFKPPAGGTSKDLRRSAASIQQQVQKAQKVFGGNTIVDGGKKVKG